MREPAPVLVADAPTFKKRWGGHEAFYNLEVVLSSISHYLPERVRSPR
jgi:hypothetical protein